MDFKLNACCGNRPTGETVPVVQSGVIAIASAVAAITLIGCLTLILMQQSSTLSALVCGFEAKWLYVGMGLSVTVGLASLTLIARLICCSRRVLIHEDLPDQNATLLAVEVILQPTHAI